MKESPSSELYRERRHAYGGIVRIREVKAPPLSIQRKQPYPPQIVINDPTRDLTRRTQHYHRCRLVLRHVKQNPQFVANSKCI
jgi:hypothetical protein